MALAGSFLTNGRNATDVVPESNVHLCEVKSGLKSGLSPGSDVVVLVDVTCPDSDGFAPNKPIPLPVLEEACISDLTAAVLELLCSSCSDGFTLNKPELLLAVEEDCNTDFVELELPPDSPPDTPPVTAGAVVAVKATLDPGTRPEAEP